MHECVLCFASETQQKDGGGWMGWDGGGGWGGGGGEEAFLLGLRLVLESKTETKRGADYKSTNE